MLTIQIHIDGRWQDAAILDVKTPRKGRESAALLAYDFNYATQYLDRDDLASCSLNAAVMLIGSHFSQPWFSFLDDIMPAGASRRYWVAQLGLQSTSPAEQDYNLLKAGTIAPVGNLRVKESLSPLPEGSQLKTRRFPAEWAIERDTDFLELDEFIPQEELLQAMKTLADKLRGLKTRLAARGVPESILEMPGMGFNFLDQRIAGWQL